MVYILVLTLIIGFIECFVNIKYELLHHDTTYTCEQLAHKLHVPPRNIAKTVIIKYDKVFSI